MELTDEDKALEELFGKQIPEDVEILEHNPMFTIRYLIFSFEYHRGRWHYIGICMDEDILEDLPPQLRKIVEETINEI